MSLAALRVIQIREDKEGNEEVFSFTRNEALLSELFADLLDSSSLSKPTTSRDRTVEIEVPGRYSLKNFYLFAHYVASTDVGKLRMSRANETNGFTRAPMFGSGELRAPEYLRPLDVYREFYVEQYLHSPLYFDFLIATLVHLFYTYAPDYESIDALGSAISREIYLRLPLCYVPRSVVDRSFARQYRSLNTNSASFRPFPFYLGDIIEKRMKFNVLDSQVYKSELGWTKEGIELRFYEDNDVYRISEYKNNLLTGLSEIWNQDGSLIQSTYKEGKLDGWNNWYYADGTPQRRLFFKNNKVEGLYLTWFPDGSKQEISRFKDGQRSGIQERWSSSGTLVSKRDFRGTEIFDMLSGASLSLSELD